MVGKNNAFIQKQYQIYQQMLNVGMDTGFQKCWDLIQLCLHDPEIMGKDTFGKERIKRLYRGLVKYEHDFGVALMGEKESDYYQEKLDSRLREIWGDELCPFKDRYPDLKQPNYNRGKKRWRE